MRSILTFAALMAFLPLACGPSEEETQEKQFQAELQGLSSPDRQKRMEAARGMVEHRGDKRAVRSLLVALAHEEDPEVREAIVASLGEIGDPEATPALTALLSHEDPEVQRVAIVALGKIGKESGDKRAVPALIDRLARGVPWIRALAAGALHQVTNHSVEIDWLDEFAVREGVRLWETWEKEHRYEIPPIVEAGPVTPAGEKEAWWKRMDREAAMKKRPAWPKEAENPPPPPIPGVPPPPPAP